MERVKEWCANRILGLADKVQEWLSKYREKPGLTAEMERWDKATENLARLREYGLNPVEVARHKERMLGTLEEETEHLSPEVSEGIFLMANRIAFNAGDAALVSSHLWHLLLLQAVQGSEHSRDFLLEETAFDVVMEWCQRDFAWAVEILDRYDGYEEGMRSIVDGHRGELYMRDEFLSEIREKQQLLREMASEEEGTD